jgi:hypothetical protein
MLKAALRNEKDASAMRREKLVVLEVELSSQKL